MKKYIGPARQKRDKNGTERKGEIRFAGKSEGCEFTGRMRNGG